MTAPTKWAVLQSPSNDGPGTQESPGLSAQRFDHERQHVVAVRGQRDAFEIDMAGTFDQPEPLGLVRAREHRTHFRNGGAIIARAGSEGIAFERQCDIFLI
jgi:hypothetical protein